MLIYSNHVPSLLHYLSCVIQVFTNCRLSFKPTKCDFFKERVEFDDTDLTTYGNCPAVSKFNLIQHWPLPPNVISLLSFIGLYGFYSQYCPWFEKNIKPLRKLEHINMDLTIIFIDVNKKVISTLPMDLPMALLVAIPVALPTVLPTALPTALSMTLPTAWPIASSLMTDTNDKVSSTLTFSLVTNDTNIDLQWPLLPYPNISLSFHFHCITCIDFTYHSL